MDESANPVWRTSLPNGRVWPGIGMTMSTASLKVRLCRYYRILSIGRWLNAKHLQIQSLDQWTRTTAADSLVMLAGETSGEWSHRQEHVRNFGKPLAPRTRIAGMTSLRIFFQDLQQWDIIPRAASIHIGRSGLHAQSVACWSETLASSLMMFGLSSFEPD